MGINYFMRYNSRLIQEWKKIAKDLGLEIIAPYKLEIKKNEFIVVDIFLKYFASEIGILIVSDYSIIKKWEEEIDNLGYAYSVLEPLDNIESYDREVMIEVLNEWGWDGPDDKKPGWCD